MPYLASLLGKLIDVSMSFSIAFSLSRESFDRELFRSGVESHSLFQRSFTSGYQGEERVTAASSAVLGPLGIRLGMGVVKRCD